MSHFTRIKTVLTEIDILETALESTLGWEVRRDAVVRGWMGKQEGADLVAVNPGASYDVGFSRDEEGSFALVADFYGLKNLPCKQDELSGVISQNYALEVVRQESERMGFAMGDVTVAEDGSLQLALTRW